VKHLAIYPSIDIDQLTLWVAVDMVHTPDLIAYEHLIVLVIYDNGEGESNGREIDEQVACLVDHHGMEALPITDGLNGHGMKVLQGGTHHIAFSSGWLI
jgi:hypothetical protein